MDDRANGKLSLVLSSEAAECGLACIVMVANTMGHDIDLASLRRRHSVSLAGLTVRGMVGICSGLGLASRPVRAELDELPLLRTPAILHWDMNHFVVLKSATARRLVIYDPSRGVRSMTPSEASSHFTGVALELSPVADFEALQSRQSIRLSSLWSESHGIASAALQVIALSVVLQLLTFAMPFQVQLAVDEAIGNGDAPFITVLALGFAGVIVLRTGVDFLRSWLLQIFTASSGYQVIGNIVSHLMRLRADWYEKRHVGDIMSRIRSANVVQEIAVTTVVMSVLDAVMALTAIVIIWFYSPIVAMVAIGFTAVTLAISSAMVRPMALKAQEEIVERAREQSHLMESIRAAGTIKMMAREATREGEWRNIYLKAMNATLGLGRLKILLGSTQTLLAGLQQVTVIAVAAMMVISGDGLSLGMMFALLSFRQTFSDRMGALVSQLVQIRFIGLHLDRLSDIVIEEREDPPARTSAALNTALLAPEKFKGSIAFQDVSFTYGVGQEPVLKNVTFAVNPGEFIAISGASGSGKTTLLKLLLGLLQPTSGQILLDGFPASPAAWRSFRQAAGVVVQDDRLLSGSVGDNISFFDAEGTFGQIVNAARKASIHEDIMSLPMQYQTLVGDMGSALSGGQKQRVLIARALYREPAILILDEGTANLDYANERIISTTVTQMTATRIIVSHRSDLITYVDRMIVVGGGGIEDVRTLHGPDPILATASV